MSFVGKKIFYCSLLIVFISCRKDIEKPKSEMFFTDMFADSLQKPMVLKVLKCFQTKNYKNIGTIIHPVKNLRFSPNGNIDLRNDKYFSSETFLLLVKNPIPILWGKHRTTGDSIYMTWKKYCTKFVFDVDFTNNPKMYINKLHSKHKTLDNLKDIYPKSDFATFYIEDFDPKHNTQRCKSLKIVFEKYRGRWYLVGVVHDRWTG